jgi:hypothetical protein
MFITLSTRGQLELQFGVPVVPGRTVSYSGYRAVQGVQCVLSMTIPAGAQYDRSIMFAFSAQRC